MPLPALLDRLRLPVVVAPMFLASGPDLVVESCRAGMVGSFPSLNRRSTAEFGDWLDEIEARLAAYPDAAPFAVNLIVNRSSDRVGEDLEMILRHRVPIVITSLGAAPEVVEAVHGYGGIVWHDVINLRHARKAIAAGVDGIVAVSAGAGGHAGLTHPFALVQEIRAIFDGTILMSGAISTGAQVAAARMAGADLAYVGTRFIATEESYAPQGFKDMTVAARAEDIVYTDAVSGVNANFLRPSIRAAGLDPDNLPPVAGKGHRGPDARPKAWKNIWSAGQGVGVVDAVLPVAELAARMAAEYASAVNALACDRFAPGAAG